MPVDLKKHLCLAAFLVGIWLSPHTKAHAGDGEGIPDTVVFTRHVLTAAVTLVGNTAALACKKNRLRMGIASLSMNTLSTLLSIPIIVSASSYSTSGGVNMQNVVGPFYALWNVSMLSYSLFTMFMELDQHIARHIGTWSGALLLLFSGISAAFGLIAPVDHGLLFFSAGLGTVAGISLFGMGLHGLLTSPHRSPKARPKGQTQLSVLPWLSPTREQGLHGGLMLQGCF